MRVEVMQFFGLTNPLTQAGYYETDTHKQLTKDIRAAILEGRLIALCGVMGLGPALVAAKCGLRIRGKCRFVNL
ncbi:hypothetical protein P349_04916 [Enterobacter sp. DC4]|nr:hypothetical protein P349_04916 [Enterobacter sp. DC4]